MCKSIAQGGKRCSAHARQSAVVRGVIPFVAATCGETKETVTATLARIEDASAGMTEPDQAVVDSWLRDTAAAVAADHRVDLRVRSQIGQRLRDAVGCLRLTGAQFTALRAVIAEALARHRQRFAAVLMVGALATGVGGCAAGTHTAVSPTPAVSATQIAENPEFANPRIVTPDVPADVSKSLGEKRALDAYTVGAEFLLSHQLDARLLSTPRDAVEAKDFVAVRKSLTASARADWDRALADPVANRDTLAALTYFGAVDDLQGGEGAKIVVRDDVPLTVVNRQVARPRLDPAGPGRVKMTVDCTAELRVREDAAGGVNYLIPYRASTELTLARDGNRWLIDGWSTRWSPDERAIEDD